MGKGAGWWGQRRLPRGADRSVTAGDAVRGRGGGGRWGGEPVDGMMVAPWRSWRGRFMGHGVSLTLGWNSEEAVQEQWCTLVRFVAGLVRNTAGWFV